MNKVINPSAKELQNDMYNHAPVDYKCPICLAVQGIESEETMMKQDDIVYRDDLVVAAISSKFIEGNPGHVIVFPAKHYENIFEIPEEEANRVMRVAKQIATAMKKVRKCDGIILQQNNEPAAGQHAFHFHMHVIPRFEGDNYHEHSMRARVSDPSERKVFSVELKNELQYDN